MKKEEEKKLTNTKTAGLRILCTKEKASQVFGFGQLLSSQVSVVIELGSDVVLGFGAVFNDVLVAGVPVCLCAEVMPPLHDVTLRIKKGLDKGII